MAKRSISDDEVALIRAMLARGMKNNEIQFYFNRQDRPVNSGRVTGIRQGTYAPDVVPAADSALATFMRDFKPGSILSAVGGRLSSAAPTDEERVAALQRR